MSVRPLSIYLAGPIDQVIDHQISSIESWKTELMALVSHLPIVAFDPLTAYRLTPQRHRANSSFVCETNAVAYNTADVIVAYLPKGVPTIGTIVELVDCISKKRVILISDIVPGESISLDGLCDRALSLMHHRICLRGHSAESWRDALGEVHDILLKTCGGNSEMSIKKGA